MIELKTSEELEDLVLLNLDLLAQDLSRLFLFCQMFLKLCCVVVYFLTRSIVAIQMFEHFYLIVKRLRSLKTQTDCAFTYLLW